MPVKRSRADRSSGQLEKPVAATASTKCQLKVKKADGDTAAEPSQQNPFGVAYAVDAGQSEGTRFGEFLERCYYCNKRIAQNSEVFMYSNFCAFCSPECRDYQILLDQSAENQSMNQKENLSQGQGFHNVKR